MKSHEYAKKMQEIADFLLSRPEFDTDGHPTVYLWYWNDKEKFLGAVRALGAGKKEYRDDDLIFTVPVSNDVEITLKVNRDAVCRKVQDAVWECEPLLSPEEEASIEAQ